MGVLGSEGKGSFPTSLEPSQSASPGPESAEEGEKGGRSGKGYRAADGHVTLGLARKQVACRLEFGPPQVSVRSKSMFGGKNSKGKKRRPRSERISEVEFEKVQI